MLKRKTNRKKKEKKSKGLSTVIATLLVIVLTMVAIGIIWVILKNVILNQSESAETQKYFFSEDVEIAFLRVNESSVNISLEKIGGNTKIKSEGQNVTVDEKVQADIISVVDLSGSMRSCDRVTSNCCTNILKGSYSSGNCSGVNLIVKNNCTSICGGIWTDRLTAAQDANKELINILSEAEGSRIGLVGYNTSMINSAGVDLTADVNQLNNKIDSWQARGSTCVCCGINEAVRKLQLQSSSDRAKKIIIMSDGDANVQCPLQNTHDPMQDAIKSACDAKANLNNLIIYSIGVGGSVNEATLISIASCGSGKYFSAINISELIDVYKRVIEEIKTIPKSTSQFNYLYIIFYNGTSSYKEKISEIPDALVTKSYKFDLTGKLSGKIEKIEIYAVILTSSGREVIGPLFDSRELK